MPTQAEFHRRSLAERERFWAEQADLIHWHKRPSVICNDRNAPFVRWFEGGETNLCFNAVDRHAAERPDALALVFISTETEETRRYTFAELKSEVMCAAAMLQDLGVGRGDRVLIYLPNTAEACFVMLACVRIGAIHSVVFGGFAAASLATRIDDARPKLLICADAGMRAGKPVPYKHLVDEACRLAQNPPAKVLILDRGIDRGYARIPGRDVDYAELRREHLGAEVPVTWLESNEPSYILYTSGTTGRPKGVQRDTGGYAVALAASMRHIYCGQPGETYFATSDIGWAVGHSYIIYGPLIAGMSTIMYEGTPIRPDPGVWWRIVQDYRISVMFSAPTAIRVLKKQDPAYLRQYDLDSLRHLFLAGEPLDQPTHEWIATALGKPVIDHYWQTESGWPILSSSPGIEATPIKYGSPSFPVYGYDVRLFREDGSECGADEKGILGIVPPLPPGCLSTVWGDDARFVSTYFSLFKTPLVYSSFDWGLRDRDGYYFILGRTDDVINVAGHRLGTREIEEAVQAHPNIAEVAVVGVQDALKGQLPVAFAVVKDASCLESAEGRAAEERAVMQKVDALLGAIARPARVYFVSLLPKTRSGKLLRRSIQALAEGRDPGDLTTIEDPAALQQIRTALGA